MKPDLHIHSALSSDGEFSVAELVDKITDAGIDTFSITDHNVAHGNEEAAFLSIQKGINFIPGIEIDCSFNGTDLHLLGYHINWQSRDFAALENDVRTKTMESFSEMIHNINRLGFDVTEEEVLEKAKGNLPTGELIAEILLSKEGYDNKDLLPYRSGGARSDMPYLNFYHDYFAQSKPAYAFIRFMNYTDAIELVMDNGGIPIVAHPGLNFKGKEEVAEKLLAKGARGLEAFNNYHDARQIDYFASLAEKRNALITCGSDFHGKTKPVISPGNYRTDNRYMKYLTESVQWLKQFRYLA